MADPDAAWRRALAVTVSVATWLIGGWALALDANGYRLLGIPFTLLFQIGARRASCGYAAARPFPSSDVHGGTRLLRSRSFPWPGSSMPCVRAHG
jgi:hypothetical protein